MSALGVLKYAETLLWLEAGLSSQELQEEMTVALVPAQIPMEAAAVVVQAEMPEVPAEVVAAVVVLVRILALSFV